MQAYLCPMKKAEIHSFLMQYLDKKRQDLVGLMNALKESGEADTKSSAGDKHETGKAMVHLEQEKLSSSLLNIEEDLKRLSQLNTAEGDDFVKAGSLVFTQHATLYIGIGLGPIQIGDQQLIMLNQGAPLAKMFLGKKMGDQVVFNQQHYKIEKIL